MLLTDDEISRALRDEGYTDEVHAELGVIAKKQLKEMVDWGEEECFEHPYTSKLKSEEYNRKRHRCPKCWQSLLEEIENT